MLPSSATAAAAAAAAAAASVLTGLASWPVCARAASRTSLLAWPSSSGRHPHPHPHQQQRFQVRRMSSMHSTQPQADLIPLGKYMQIPSDTVYAPGQVFLHRLFGYRCVVLDHWVADVVETIKPGNFPSSSSSPYLLTLPHSNQSSPASSPPSSSSSSPRPSIPASSEATGTTASASSEQDTSDSPPPDDDFTAISKTGDSSLNINSPSKFYQRRDSLLSKRLFALMKTFVKKRNYYIAVCDERDRRATYSNTPYMFVPHDDILPYTPVYGHTFQFARFNEWFQTIPFEASKLSDNKASAHGDSLPAPSLSSPLPGVSLSTPTSPPSKRRGTHDSSAASEVLSGGDGAASGAAGSLDDGSDNYPYPSAEPSSGESEEDVIYSTDKGYPFDQSRAPASSASSLSAPASSASHTLLTYQYVKYAPTSALEMIRQRNAIIGLHSKVYIQISGDVRVTAIPWYFGFSMGHNSYIWTCNIVIENLGKSTMRLRRRHWAITDASGRVKLISGLGVAAGTEPVLGPHARTAFEYTTGIDLQTNSGDMKGVFEFERIEQNSTSKFHVHVPCFVLHAPP